MRVLVIDDDPAIRDMLDLVLGLEGFDVELAEDGQAGLERARTSRPDAIVLDVMMPRLNGWDVAEAIRREPGLIEVPIVFCTAMGDGESTWRGWQLGAASYVAKPFGNDQLVDELFRALRPQSADLVGEPA